MVTLAAIAAAAPACASHASPAPGDGSDDAITMGTKPWDAPTEAAWEKFIAGIGQARVAGRCTTMAACLNDSTINPYKAAEDPELQLVADCSKLAISLRAYFALKTGHPFKYVSEITGDAPANLQPGQEPDYRYTVNNHPTNWSTAKTAPDIQGLLTRISTLYHSGFYRMSPDIEEDDTYPIDVRPDTVHPGTVYYDPNGHVLVVFQVDGDGTVHFIDTHPDNSMTVTILSDKLAVGSRGQGGGFRNFRPLVNDNGRLAYTPNAQLTDLSDAQYGRGHGYYDWVQQQLSGGKAVSPDIQFGKLLDQLCQDMGDRVAAVDAGKSLTATDPMPDLPPNIYGADGDWEAYSTPGRDQKLRASFRGIYQLVQSSSSDASAISKMQASWSQHQGSSACKVTYTNSNGDPVTLTLNDVQARLFALSFDPYQCAELRWGAASGSEYTTCNTQDDAHVQRYNDEQTLRNIIDRPAPGTPTPIGFGPAQPDDVDVAALLKRLGG